MGDIFQRYDGIIVESFGTGGIPDSLLDEFSRLMRRYENSRKAVVMTTQVTYEGSNLGIYEVGRRIRDEFQILEAWEMNLEAVLTKLMWILGQIRKILIRSGRRFTGESILIFLFNDREENSDGL